MDDRRQSPLVLVRVPAAHVVVDSHCGLGRVVASLETGDPVSRLPALAGDVVEVHRVGGIVVVVIVVFAGFDFVDDDLWRGVRWDLFSL